MSVERQISSVIHQPLRSGERDWSSCLYPITARAFHCVPAFQRSSVPGVFQKMPYIPRHFIYLYFFTLLSLLHDFPRCQSINHLNISLTKLVRIAARKIKILLLPEKKSKKTLQAHTLKRYAHIYGFTT